MIRSVQPEDTPALLALAQATALFDPSGIEELGSLLADYFGGNLPADHSWITDEAQSLVGVAYYAPERMTDRTWNLYLIAVHPDYQGQGRGTALLQHVEQTLAERGERLLLVETSSLESFARTRAFYRKNGYAEEAQVRNFYAAGEDKIIFTRALAAQNP